MVCHLVHIVPKFAIGTDFHTFYAQHHIDSPNEPHDSYHVYIKENSKDLLVEPRIQVFPPSATTAGNSYNDGKKNDVDDVCEYRILPPIRPALSPLETTNNSSSAAGTRRPLDEHDVGLDHETQKTHEPRTTNDEDYDDDELDDEEEQEDLPFIIRPSRENKHEAIIEVTKPLNCEHKKGYEFDIVAVSCAGDVSKR